MCSQGTGSSLRGFNPHPVRTPGATFTTSYTVDALTSFQSSPSANTGCYRVNGTLTIVLMFRFQSSPSANTGCYDALCWAAHPGFQCFNPHPVRTPGATLYRFSSAKSFATVSILTQCEHRVLQLHAAGRHANVLVSILTQCEHRVLLLASQGATGRLSGFNPHPVRTPGATLVQEGQEAGRVLFQSSPSANTGCYFFQQLTVLGQRTFQSSPSANTGCYTACKRAWTSVTWFQSSPSANTGCYNGKPMSEQAHACFNPHPVRTPGATGSQTVSSC